MGDVVSSLGFEIAIPGSYSTLIAQGQPGGLPIPSSQYLNQYARCSDLFGDQIGLVLCSSYTRSAVTKYFWGSVRPDWKISIPVSVLTLSALKSPSKIRFTGTTAVANQITLDDTNAYPGLTYDIAADFTGIGSLSFTGLSIIGTISGMLLGTRKRISFDGTGWAQE